MKTPSKLAIAQKFHDALNIALNRKRNLDERVKKRNDEAKDAAELANRSLESIVGSLNKKKEIKSANLSSASFMDPTAVRPNEFNPSFKCNSSQCENVR